MLKTIFSALSEAADLSQFGSKIGVMNGQTGNWMANVTGELFQLFSELSHRESDDCMIASKSSDTILNIIGKITAFC